MDAIVLTWRELLIAIVLATLVYLLEVAVFSRLRRPKGQGEATMSDSTVQELSQLRAEVASLRQRLDSLEAQLKSAAANKAAEDTPYGRAVRLAREGLTAQELANRCGISRGEAELIIALNRPLP